MDDYCIQLRRYVETDLFEITDFLKEQCLTCFNGIGYDLECDDYITNQEIGELLLKGFYGN